MAPDNDQRYAEDDKGEFEDEFDPEALDGGGLDARANRENDYEERFKAASKTIKRKRTFDQDDDVDAFFDEYGDIAGKTTKDTGNLLHVLVEAVKHTEEIESDDVERLVRRLVEKSPDLLRCKNRDGQNPVYMAIRASNHRFVDYMVSTCVRNKDRNITGLKHMECLDGALQMTAQEGKTSLHLAIIENLNPDTIKRLVESASNKALAVKDNSGKTPMHYAVSFSRCTDVRTQLITLFIERDLSANAVQGTSKPETLFLDVLDGDGRSVYQEHQITKEIVTTKYNTWVAATKPGRVDSTTASTGTSRTIDRTASKPPKETSRSLAGGKDLRRAAFSKAEGERSTDKSGCDDNESEKLDDREKRRKQKKVEEADRLKMEESESGTSKRENGGDRVGDRETANVDAGRNTRSKAKYLDSNAIPVTIRTSSTTRQQEPSPNTPIKRASTSRVEDKSAQEKLPERSSRPTKGTNATDKGNMTVWRKNSEEILSSLKLHYMRTRSAEMAISFIYGTNMDGESDQSG